MKVRSGFSFIEIMFAVMILGIGFILVAGVFPVALAQTQANGDETVASSIGREGAAYLGNLPGTAELMAADNGVHRFGPGGPVVNYNGGIVDCDATLWDLVRGNLTLPEDPRYAWVPFYLRRIDAGGQPAEAAQVIVIATRVRNHSAYTPATDYPAGSGGGFNATLMGKVVSATVSVGAGSNPDTITFSGTHAGAVAPGAFVIIARDSSASQSGLSATGWVLKVGNNVGGNEWQLQPGGDLKNSPGYTPGNLICWVVGQGFDPDNVNTFTGGAQDIMAYTTFISLK